MGDNGEQDARFYDQIVKEYAGQGIQFDQYIHILYSKSELKYSKILTQSSEQIGFVTSTELAQGYPDAQ